MDEQIGAPEKRAPIAAEVPGGQREGRQHPRHRILGGGRGLVHVEEAFVVLDQEVGEGPAGIDGESHRFELESPAADPATAIGRSERSSP